MLGPARATVVAARVTKREAAAGVGGRHVELTQARERHRANDTQENLDLLNVARAGYAPARDALAAAREAHATALSDRATARGTYENVRVRRSARASGSSPPTSPSPSLVPGEPYVLVPLPFCADGSNCGIPVVPDADGVARGVESPDLLTRANVVLLVVGPQDGATPAQVAVHRYADQVEVARLDVVIP